MVYWGETSGWGRVVPDEQYLVIHDPYRSRDTGELFASVTGMWAFRGELAPGRINYNFIALVESQVPADLWAAAQNDRFFGGKDVFAISATEWRLQENRADFFDRQFEEIIGFEFESFRTSNSYHLLAAESVRQASADPGRLWFAHTIPQDAVDAVNKFNYPARKKLLPTIKSATEYLASEVRERAAEMTAITDEVFALKAFRDRRAPNVLTRKWAEEWRAEFDGYTRESAVERAEKRLRKILSGEIGSTDPTIVRQLLKERLELAAAEKSDWLRGASTPAGKTIAPSCDQQAEALRQVALHLHLGLMDLEVEDDDVAKLEALYETHRFKIAALKARNSPVWFVAGERIESLSGAGQASYTWTVPADAAIDSDGWLDCPIDIRIEDQHESKRRPVPVETIVDMDTVGAVDHPIVIIGRRSNRKGEVQVGWRSEPPRLPVAGSYVLRLRSRNACGPADLDLTITVAT